MEHITTIIITRPNLARDLTRSGYSYREIPNPWVPDRTAWSFEIAPGMADIIRDHYAEHGLPVPKGTAGRLAAYEQQNNNII